MKKHRTFIQTPVISSGVAYTAGDAVGGKLTFSGLAYQNTSGDFDTLVILDKGQQNAALDLVLFSADFTPTADNVAFDPSDTDLDNCIGVIPIGATDYFGFVDNSVASKTLANMLGFQITQNVIYGQLVTRGTPTYTSTSDLTVKLTLEQD